MLYLSSRAPGRRWRSSAAGPERRLPAEEYWQARYEDASRKHTRAREPAPGGVRSRRWAPALSLRGSRRSLPRSSKHGARRAAFLFIGVGNALAGMAHSMQKRAAPMTGRNRVWTGRHRVGREGACSSFVQREMCESKRTCSCAGFGPFLEKALMRASMVEAPGADRSETHQPEAHESVCSTSLLSHKLIHSTA